MGTAEKFFEISVSSVPHNEKMYFHISAPQMDYIHDSKSQQISRIFHGLRAEESLFFKLGGESEYFECFSIQTWGAIHITK